MREIYINSQQQQQVLMNLKMGSWWTLMYQVKIISLIEMNGGWWMATEKGDRSDRHTLTLVVVTCAKMSSPSVLVDCLSLSLSLTCYYNSFFFGFLSWLGFSIFLNLALEVKSWIWGHSLCLFLWDDSERKTNFLRENSLQTRRQIALVRGKWKFFLKCLFYCLSFISH